MKKNNKKVKNKGRDNVKNKNKKNTVKNKNNSKNKKKKGLEAKSKKSTTVKKKKVAKKVSVKKKKITKNKVIAKKKKPSSKKSSAIKQKKKVTTGKHKKSIIKKSMVNLIQNTETIISGPMGIKPYVLSKNEFYMNDKQVEHFKVILTMWKEQLIGEMNRTMQHIKNDAANFPDPIDRASQEEEFNLELKTRERERKLIKKIDEALEKIQGGDYGFCVDCGAEIGIKRLEARPTASQCIECKTIAEIREKQIGG